MGKKYSQLSVENGTEQNGFLMFWGNNRMSATTRVEGAGQSGEVGAGGRCGAEWGGGGRREAGPALLTGTLQ